MTHEDYRLTEEQIQLFEVFGFLVRRNLFSPEEMNRINEEFDRRLASILEETDPEEKRLFNNWGNRTPETPFIASLLEDARIYLPAEQLLDEDSFPVHSNANSYENSTNWHPDWSDPHLLAIKNVMISPQLTSIRNPL